MSRDREKLVSYLKAQKVDENIVDAFGVVLRELFVPEQVIGYAYEDLALPLDDGSTISQPSTIALMLQLLQPRQNQRILEIGSGSGYVLALISHIIKSGKVYGLEINPNLAVKSKKLLEKDSNIEIINRSGFNGLPEHAPYDRILVSASLPDRRIPYKLLDQLQDSGIIVVPIKNTIFKITKKEDTITEEEFPGFTFVPFVTKENK